jgi:hypothetical protein
MFKTFRNFPRKKDPANILAQELPPDIFVIDGVNDTSTGMWISPTRNETTDDGTLHIGLMNPFGGAQSSIVTTTSGTDNCNDFNQDPPEQACIDVCNVCNCELVRAEVNAERFKAGEEWFYEFSDCLQESNDGNGNCSLKCIVTRFDPDGQFGGGAFEFKPCAGQSNFSCGPDEPGGTIIPEHETSTIIRAIERFILDLDLNQIQTINPETISSAILRLPIKSKRDWM